jgi:uncharacterized membrane protein YhaH (DUF805 family)
MNIKKFLDPIFLKFLFFSLSGRINRQTWWYCQFFLVFLGVLTLVPVSYLLTSLDLDKLQIEKFISIFPDSKRLHDRSINGLFAILPYLFAIPMQFHFVPDFLLKFYIILMWVLKAYIFVNTGILKGDEGTNKHGDLDNFDS